MRSDDVLRWRRDGAEGVVSYNADAAYIYCRSDGSGVSFVLLLLNSSLLLTTEKAGVFSTEIKGTVPVQDAHMCCRVLVLSFLCCK